MHQFRMLRTMGLAIALLATVSCLPLRAQQAGDTTAPIKAKGKKHAKKSPVSSAPVPSTADSGSAGTSRPSTGNATDPINPSSSPEPPTPTTQGPPPAPTTPSTNAPQAAH